MSKNTIYLVFFIILSSCTSSIEQKNTEKLFLDYDKILHVQMGQTYEQVINLLGNPQGKTTEVRKELSSLDYRNFDEFSSQRATIQLDSSNKVVSVIFIPNADEVESSLEYLIKKHKNLNLIYFYKARCSPHTSLTESIAVSRDQGVLIKYSRNDLAVRSISWVTIERLDHVVQTLEACQKGQGKP